MEAICGTARVCRAGGGRGGTAMPGQSFGKMQPVRMVITDIYRTSEKQWNPIRIGLPTVKEKD